MKRAQLLALVATVVASSCVGLRPAAESARFYHLRPVSAPAPRVAGSSIGVERVRLPAYLNRSRVVERLSAAEVRLMPRDYWAAPLDEQITAVLAEEIRALTGVQAVPSPWPSGARPERRIRVEILRFDADATGMVELRARWSLLSATGPAGEVSTTERTTAATPDRVEAMSRALATLAREISVALR